MDELLEAMNNKNVKVTFGLTPKIITCIEEEIARYGGKEFDAKYSRYIWDKLGKEVGWEPFTLALYYFEYLERKTKL